MRKQIDVLTASDQAKTRELIELRKRLGLPMGILS